MQSNNQIKKILGTITLCAVFPFPLYAQDDDTAIRIKELEAKMQMLQQQRVEQDKQIEVLTTELAGIGNKLSQTKNASIEKKEVSKGEPVYAEFKDGVTLQDSTGNWKVAINGRVQEDYRAFSPDVDAADTFSLRRARLGGTFTFYKDFVARVEGDYSGGSTSLTYGYFDINKFKAAKIRFGQFKPSYGLERSNNANFMDFQERSMGDALLGSTFDRGIMVFGSPTPGFNYSVAYLNGNGTSDENNAKSDGKDITVRLTSNISELMSLKNSVLHVGGFYSNGEEATRRLPSTVPQGRTAARGLNFFQTTCPASNCGASVSNGFGEDVQRTMSGLETALAYGPFKLQSEYFNVKFDGHGFDRTITDWYASAMWNVTGESFADFYKEGVFGRLRPKNNYQDGKSGWGALQLGFRYDQFDGSDYKKTARGSNAAGGILLNSPTSTTDGVLVATNQANAWTLGANWILNPNVRFVTNLIRTNYDTPVLVRVNGKSDSVSHENALTMRAQFDF